MPSEWEPLDINVEIERKIADPRSNAIGWHARKKEEAKAGSTVHAPGCDCGFCKAGFTTSVSTLG